MTWKLHTLRVAARGLSALLTPAVAADGKFNNSPPERA
jgi:hypothetical protein